MKKYFLGQVTQKAILKYKDTYVLVKEKNQDEWILPGGRLDYGEKPEEGLKREIQEELSVGCIVGDIVSVDVYHSEDKVKTPKLFLFYKAEIKEGEEIRINHEVEEICFVSSKQDIASLPMFNNQRHALEAFLV
jgi:ADP-ribose pyrophosphatase YjhB (NUDIX family)